MNKKIMLLSFVLSGNVMAQVQLYGALDYGASYRYDVNSNLKTPQSNISRSNFKVDGGLSTDNMIGLKAVEDLGSGVQTFVVLERSFNLDTGIDGDGFDLSALLGFETPWGTLSGGRMITPYHELLSGLDPFGAGTVGTYQNTKSDVSGFLFQERALLDLDRMSNALLYSSPNWGGWNAVLGYANHALEADSVDNSKNASLWTIGVNYSTDQASLGATYHYLDLKNTFSPAQNLHNFSLGGSYDFERIKVSAFWSSDRLKWAKGERIGNKNKITQDHFLFGVNVPVGAHEVKASVNYSHNAPFGNALQVAIGGDYNLSKRTALFAAYSFINNQKTNNNRLGRFAVTNDTQNGDGAYEQAVQIGVRHLF